jgi:adenine-specific DNA-methyltransferase
MARVPGVQFLVACAPGMSDAQYYLLGFSDDTAYFFYYEKDRVTYLNIEFLARLPFRPAESVIYADTCLLEKEELKRYNITFKKIPRDITRF